jgi:hypothetical protein
LDVHISVSISPEDNVYTFAVQVVAVKALLTEKSNWHIVSFVAGV